MSNKTTSNKVPNDNAGIAAGELLCDAPEAPGSSYWHYPECGQDHVVLRRDKFVPGRYALDDKNVVRSYGWARREGWWKDEPDGQFIAEVPQWGDEDGYDDTREVGRFDRIEDAMAAIIENNNPITSHCYV